MALFENNVVVSTWRNLPLALKVVVTLTLIATCVTQLDSAAEVVKRHKIVERVQATFEERCAVISYTQGGGYGTVFNTPCSLSLERARASCESVNDVGSCSGYVRSTAVAAVFRCTAPHGQTVYIGGYGDTYSEAYRMATSHARQKGYYGYSCLVTIAVDARFGKLN